MSSNGKTKARVQDEDLDDLDDILEQFDQPKVTAKESPTAPTPQTTMTTPAKPKEPSASNDRATSAENPELDQDATELLRLLSAGMESFVRELGDQSNGDWEKMLIDGMNGLGGPEGSNSKPNPPANVPDTGDSKKAPAAPPSTSVKEEDEFQRSIRQTMEKLKESGTNLENASASGSADPLEALLKQLGGDLNSLDPNGDGTGTNDEDVQGMLENMMHQLMSKEILYEPLKELHEKLPKYIADNTSTLSADDKSRYENQLRCLDQIIVIFEDAKYRDEDKEMSGKVVALMNEMQTYGTPPQEVMGALPAGLDLDENGEVKMPDGCVIS